MEILAQKMANAISRSLHYDVEKEKVIAYGLTAMIQTIATVLLTFILSLLLGTPVEALIICFSVSSLRRFSGGTHVRYIEECAMIGVLYCVSFSFVSKYLLLAVLNFYWMSAAISIVYIWSFLMVYRLAPVDCPNKPIRSENKKKRMRKGAFITLFVFLSFSVLFLLLSLRFQYMDSLGVSLLFGVVWQTFTLTKFGSIFLNKIDTIISRVFQIGKECICNEKTE